MIHLREIYDVLAPGNGEAETVSAMRGSTGLSPALGVGTTQVKQSESVSVDLEQLLFMVIESAKNLLLSVSVGTVILSF
jgi:hypothetical protein